MDDIKKELPEVLEFMKLSRTLIRQMKLLQSTEISPKNKKIVDEVVEKIHKKTEKYLGGK